MRALAAALVLLVACHKAPPNKTEDELDKWYGRMNDVVKTAEELGDKEQAELAAQSKKLDGIVDQTDAAIADKDYDKAELLASKIHWTDDPWAKSGNDSYDKKYDAIREARLDVIKRHR